MRRSALVWSLLVLAACSDEAGNPFNGPVQMGIDPATNHQAARAAESDSLPKTVDAVLWRGKAPDGSVALHFVTPAYAQTAVDGAPVVGAVVNSVGVGACPLTAWNPAAQTDSDGKARFWYEPGQKSGTCMAEIRYADGDTRLVTDTVVAQVAPGPVDTWSLWFEDAVVEAGRCGRPGTDRVLHVAAGSVLDWSGALLNLKDAFGNVVDPADAPADTANHAGTALQSAGQADPTEPSAGGWTLPVPTTPGEYPVWFWINGTPQTACLVAA